MHKRSASILYTPDIAQTTRKKRVAAYARVSSGKDDAIHSLSAQISYFNNLISSHADWEFVEIFADEGLTGTKDDRPEFQRMLNACRDGKIDIILAKSITRFARNTVTLLSAVRELRSLEIDVQFEEEHIQTLSAKGEFLLSVLAANAQEQSRSASENQKWRIRKKYEKGEPINGNALGYRLVDGVFWIEEEEEQTVLRIFSMYLSGMGKTAIAKKLNEEGVPTRLGKAKWHPNSIYTILTNEKYQGDLKLQKKYAVDYLTKKSKRNHGEKPIFEVKDAHDPIVTRATFSQVQKERVRRAEKFNSGGISGSYPFTGLVCCGRCGHHYRRRIANASSKYAHPAWACGQFLTFGKEACDAQQIPEDILIAKTCEVLSLDTFDENVLRKRISEIVIPEKNVLVYHFRDGIEKRAEWRHRSRRESWTPEMKERARQQTKKRWEEKKKC